MQASKGQTTLLWADDNKIKDFLFLLNLTNYELCNKN